MMFYNEEFQHKLESLWLRNDALLVPDFDASGTFIEIVSEYIRNNAANNGRHIYEIISSNAFFDFLLERIERGQNIYLGSTRLFPKFHKCYNPLDLYQIYTTFLDHYWNGKYNSNDWAYPEAYYYDEDEFLHETVPFSRSEIGEVCLTDTGLLVICIVALDCENDYMDGKIIFCSVDENDFSTYDGYFDVWCGIEKILENL